MDHSSFKVIKLLLRAIFANASCLSHPGRRRACHLLGQACTMLVERMAASCSQREEMGAAAVPCISVGLLLPPIVLHRVLTALCSALRGRVPCSMFWIASETPHQVCVLLVLILLRDAVSVCRNLET